MNDEHGNRIDSMKATGGSIPGAPGRAAFSFNHDYASPIPVLIAAPHGGRTYPRSLAGNLRFGEAAKLKLEDRFVDLIARDVAQATGAAVIVAHAPRAMIDLNRAEEDMDWGMVRRAPLSIRSRAVMSRRARTGLGLVPRRVPGLGELWRNPINELDLQQRIECVHEPYHASITSILAEIRQRWGAALLIDIHSMPPLPTMQLGDPAPEFVLGDRFGSSCDGYLCAAAFDYFASARALVSHNRPYAGGYVLDRHAEPSRNIHAFQLEICRSTYLDAELVEKGPGYARVVDIIAALTRRMALEVASLGRGYALPQAAE